MGIKGLMYFMENCCPDVYYDVDLRELASSARSRDVEPVVIVDLYNCLRWLQGDLDWICGGQFREYVDRIGSFLAAFNDAGIKLVLVGDGAPQKAKRDEWVRRRYENMSKLVYPAYDSLKRGKYPDHLKDIIPLVKSVFIFKYVFNHNVITSLREADDEIALLAKEHRAIGILAQDSDYLIYQTSAPLLSIRELNWSTLVTKCYDSARLAAVLNLKVSQLPLFAVLVGNDTVDREKLRQFHCDLIKYRGPRMPHVEKVFPAVARYIINSRLADVYQHMLRDLEWLAVSVFRDVSMLPFLERVVKDYYLDFRALKEDTAGQDESWKNVLQLFKTEYTQTLTPDLYPIMVGEHYSSSTSLEDYRESYSLPPHSLLWESTRQRVYGLLLKEKPGAVENNRFVLEVEEWCMNGPETLDSACWLTPELPENHPGLLYLHQTLTEPAQTERFRLYAWAVDPRLDPSRLVNLPPIEVNIVSILYKLHHERDRPVLQEWEVRVFILQYYILETLSVEDLRAQQAVQPTARGAQLALLLTKNHLMQVNYVVGKPIPMDQCLPHTMFDGKLFQRVYNRGPAGSIDSLWSEFRGSRRKDMHNKQDPGSFVERLYQLTL